MLSLSIHSNQKWKCPTCASNNQSNRNVIPCRNCHILQSDNNLKRANELFLLEQIILPSVALIPLKIPFFIYPLAPLFILQHSVQYKGTAASINLEIELWDNRHIENYHIESIKIVSFPTIGNSYTTSNTVINNKTPYCKQFVYHINNYYGFHTFDIYAKCYGSTRISPKKSLQITLLPLANTNLSFANNKQTTNSITLRRNNLQWYYQDDDALFKPYCHEIFTKLMRLEVGKSLQFSLEGKKYKFTKLSYDTGIQKNLSTGFERNAVLKRIYDVNNYIDIKKNKHIIDHNSPFKSHLSYLEAVTLSIGDKVDVRDVGNGYMFKGKIINIKLKKNN
eukprot:546976_1